jgi:hypothetical protein
VRAITPSKAKRLRIALEDHFALLKDAEREHAIYGNLAKAAAVNAFGATFFEVARLKWDVPTFQMLFNETRTMLGRRPAAGIVVPRTPKGKAQPDRKRRGRRMHPDEAEALRAGRIRPAAALRSGPTSVTSKPNSRPGLHHSILAESADLLRRAVLPAAVPKP